MKDLLQQSGQILPELRPGEVWLVGAGPGDVGLLTLHALHAIQSADYILYDALVDEACLRFARPEAVLEFAGKRAGCPSPKQSDITRRLLELARADKRVVRLKGGDPFVFGRGAEEVWDLAQAGIAFRVIPGITAGIAAPAYAGIPVTSRLVNQSVTFLTGHDASGEMPKHLNWSAIAQGANVLVLYMALKHIEAIAATLMAAGRAADEPLAFISHATTSAQRVVITSLARAGQTARQEKITAPAVIVIGKVVDMAALQDHLPKSMT